MPFNIHFNAALRRVLSVILAIAAPSALLAYSCGNPSSGHCYGTASWSKDGEFFGVRTSITQVAMSCAEGCNGFVDDEVWLIDTQSRGCVANRFGMCWVEAGSIASDGDDPVFFWADARPMNTSTFNLHLLGGIDSAGTIDHYMIVKDGRVSPNTFQVFIYTDSNSTLYNGVSAVPNGQPMTGHRIDIGQELAGTSGASAGTALFTRNIWAVQALGPEYVFWYNRQTTSGGVSSANPPTASWAIDPSNPIIEGGKFTTRCCS